jgi:hypothetical protein
MTKFLSRGVVAMLGSAALAAVFPIGEAAAQSILNFTGCASITVTAGNGTSNMTLSCAPPSTPPPTSTLGTCSLAPSPVQAHAPGGDLFTVTCTGGTPTSVGWVAISPSAVSGTFASSTQGASQTIAFSAAATLYATARDANQVAANQASASITAPAGSPPPTGGALFPALGCPGFAKTLTQAFEWTTPGNMVVDTYKLSGGMGDNGVLLATFVTPAGTTGATVPIGVAEYPAGSGTAVGRKINVSTSYCDFNITNSMMGQESKNSTTTLFAPLLPSTRYYVNVSNTSRGLPSCPKGSNCNLRLEITKPAGF